MSRISDLAGVLKGVRKVVVAFNKQAEAKAGDAWLQSTIREGVERAAASYPEDIGMAFVKSIPKPLLDGRIQMEKIADQLIDTGQREENIAQLKKTVRTIKRTVKGAVDSISTGNINSVVESVSSTMADFDSSDIVDKAVLDRLQGFVDDQNPGTTRDGVPPTPQNVSGDGLSAAKSLFIPYLNRIADLEHTSQRLNETIELINEQIESILVMSGSENLQFDYDENATVPGLDGSSSQPSKHDGAATGVEIDDIDLHESVQGINEIMSQLRSSIHTLQNEAASLQGSSRHIVDDINNIVNLIVKGDVEGALKTAERHIVHPEETIDPNISFTPSDIYPTAEPPEEEYREQDHECTTFGNYTDPFKPNGNPPSRGFSTFSYPVNFYTNYRSIYQNMYLRHLSLNSDKSKEPSTESFVKHEPDSLASYSAKRRTGTKQKRLDEKAKRRAVPDTKIKRALAFGGLAATLGWGTVAEMARRSINAPTSSSSKSALWTDANIEKIVSKLCEVRGAALKIGQMVSIQDESLISPEFAKIMARVRDSADYMPTHQLETQMVNNLGISWKDHFKDFDYTPFAAASLGQVHYGTLHDGSKVVIKVQYPGVADSINSDIDSLTMVLSVTNLVPKGAYIENALGIAKKELALETDYVREAASQIRMRELLADDSDFEVPKVYTALSGKHVLTQQFVEGEPIDSYMDAPMELRNDIGLKMLKLCLRELFEFQFMQTDPNWSNFFYDPVSKQIKLLDFGATLPLSNQFSADYLRIIRSCATGDRDTIIDASIQMGFLTGYESEVMINAHCEAISVVGEPFSTDEPYDFVANAAYKRIGRLLGVFGKHRLTAPPEESYALNRKLSGAYLLCTKLNAVICCKPLFDEVYHNKTRSSTPD